MFLSWGMLILSVIFNAAGVFVIKMRLNELGAIQMDSFKNVWQYCWTFIQSPIVFGGVVMFILSPFLFAVALSRMEISVAYPVQVGLNFALLLLLAVIFLGEPINFFKIVGIVLVLAGTLFLIKV